MATDKMIELKASEVKQMIKARFIAQITKGLVCRALAIEGHAGLGKTATANQTALELSSDPALKDFLKGQPVKCMSVDMMFLEAPDLNGLPFVTGIQGEEITRHARSTLLPSEGFGILFLDEANRCNRDLRQAMITLLQNRAINGMKLGDGWMPVLAMNPSEADGVTYEVAEFDTALRDRVTPIRFKGDVKEWIAYMVARYGKDNQVVRWVDAQSDVAIDFKGKTRTTPRSLEYLVRAIEANGGLTAPGIFNVIAAEIGIDAAVVFQKFVEAQKAITAAEILDTFTKDPNVAAKLEEFEEKGRNDALHTVNHQVVQLFAERVKDGAILIGNPKDKRTGNDAYKAQMANICAYLEAIPADLAYAFFQSINQVMSKDYDPITDVILANCPKLVKQLHVLKTERTAVKEKEKVAAEKKADKKK